MPIVVLPLRWYRSCGQVARMKPEAFLVILMFVVLVLALFTVHAFWRFRVDGYMGWPFG